MSEYPIPPKTETTTMDFPQAFEFIKQNAPDKTMHHPKCSYRQLGMLCDCQIIWAEYYKRKSCRLSSENDRLRQALDYVRTLRVGTEISEGAAIRLAEIIAPLPQEATATLSGKES